MLATTVTSAEELEQIVRLSYENLRTRISEEEKNEEGFVSWNYSLDLLQKMNAQFPHIIVKSGNQVVAYALVALKEAKHFHPALEEMINLLEPLTYQNRKLNEYKYYVMGQVCVDKQYRGRGIFEMLYQKHKALFERDYDFVVTEISTQNRRSVRAHEKIGFKTVYTYTDKLDQWNVVLWDWR